ncbi:hypothetical protein PZ897_02220 [Hoeflea sp. YIM 152468]|uniref:hypothetical protein n=1 Tax=Hoeflea sp. YIM 152468 TaxID=3031759 RepID=UPI0023D9C9CD|nr:hypothetical protein [Hoeflea sp. YIM 152468]MDF1606986.1 hypothetical protein [Hoeflea sp. YIM 152468]
MGVFGIDCPGGTSIDPDEWILINLPARGDVVGKFSGIWKSSRFGWMFGIKHARQTDGSKIEGTVYCPLNEKNRDRLHAAVRIRKPVWKNGTCTIEKLDQMPDPLS